MPQPLWLTKLLIRARVARFLPFAQRIAEGAVEYLPAYADRALAAPRRELAAAQAYLAPRGTEIDLTIGSPRFDLLPSATSKLTVEQRGFPPLHGIPELREAVSQTLMDQNGVAASPTDEVLITDGSTGALSVALDTFVNPRDRVVLFDPSAWHYELMVRQRRGRVTWVPTELDDGRLRFSLAAFVKAIRRAKLVLLNSPHNPTGGVVAAEDLEQIAWWCDRYGVLIFSDEVYQRYRYDGEIGVSVAGLPKGRGRTLVAGSVSKSHALAAYRVGWLAGARGLLRPCQATAALQCPFVATLSQQLALAALKLPDEAFEPVHRDFAARRQYVCERLQSMGLRHGRPGGAYYVWIPVGSYRVGGQAFADRLMRERRVAVLPGALFGPSGRDNIRISYAAEDGRLREGLNRIAETLRMLAPPAAFAQARAA